jgi:hypothetical protein
LIVLENKGFENLEWLSDHDVLSLIVSRPALFSGLSDIDGLGISFKDRLKQAFQPTMQLHRRIVKKLPPPIRRYMTTKFFLKAAPFLSIAAQVLNLLVPGLGVLVSLAISAAATAIAMKQAKDAKRKMKKVSASEEAEIAKEEVVANAEANKALDKAYKSGEVYFTSAYQMTPDKWGKLSIEDKTRFLNIVIYDKNKPSMEEHGVSRDSFVAMTIPQQQDTLAKVASTLPGSPGPYVPDNSGVITSSGTIAPFETSSSINPLFIAGGVGLVILGFFLLRD